MGDGRYRLTPMHGIVGERARESAVDPRGGLMADGTKCGSRGGLKFEPDDLGGNADGGEVEVGNVGKTRRDRARHDGHPAERESGVRHSNRCSSPTLRKNPIPRPMATRGGRAVSPHFHRPVLQPSSDVTTEHTVFEQPGDCGEVRFRPFADRAEVGRPLRESTDFPR